MAAMPVALTTGSSPGGIVVNLNNLRSFSFIYLMVSDMIDIPVLIIGGGPSGLMLANELGARQTPCLLVDAKPSTAFNPQANATQARTMEHYRRHGFAHEIRALGLPPDHPTDIAYFTRLCDDELARLSLPTAAEAVRNIRNMSGSWSAAELPHRISQKYVEPVMRRHAEKWPRVDIRFGWTLKRFVDTGTHVEAWIQPTDGSQPEVMVRARHLVGADGPRSAVRHQLGIGYEGATGMKRGYMGGQMFAVYFRSSEVYERIPHSRAWMYVAVNAERRALLASVDGVSEFAFHAAIHEGEPADDWTADDARRIVHQVMGCEIDMEVLSVQTWTAGHALVAQALARGRVFLIGDAAHLFTPTGGLGYNTGVEDAVNLGWKLAAVHHRQAPEALLGTYASERKPIAQRNTGYSRQFADSVGLFPATELLEQDSPAGEAERARASAHLNAHVRLEFNIPGVTFGGRYDGSPLIVSDGTLPPADHPNVYQPTATPGGRPPHVWLANGQSLFDRLGLGWSLLVLSPLEGAPASVEAAVVALQTAATARHVDLPVVRLDEPGLLALYEAPLALIRPDHIVAWRGQAVANATAVIDQVLGWRM
jgi:2-polyprenyl-6-methoxyphenol hydroxylase-like FAD-dependent oxidoreductase